MLELKNVCSGYGKKQVLTDISAQFEKGQITAIIGPNGCGKSTLLKTVTGILPPFSGEMTVDGENIISMSPKAAAQRIAYLSQGKAVPDMTVGQMVLHGRFPHLSYPRRYSQKDKEIANKAMEQMDILHLEQEPLSALSGGMRQNVYIAMALAQDTDYILLDEPTTYLDISNRFKLMDILKDLAASGKGIVTVLHDITLALSYSDRVTVMQEGKILMSDTAQRVFESKITDRVFNVKMQKNGSAYYYEKVDS